MNIGISGASGHLGSATVRELKARLGIRSNIVAICDWPRDAPRAGASSGGGQGHR